MDHQSFRFYIPGIVFLTPIYIVSCYIAIHHYGADIRIDENTKENIKTFILVGGIAAFPAIALPIGWWIYNAYRVWWQAWTKGYENKDFVRLISRDTKAFYSPLTQSINIDLSHITGINNWIKVSVELFRKTFCPFTSPKQFKAEIRTKGIRPKFAEPLSDFILWKDKGYEYARSISSVRYGLESSVFALLLGGLYTLGLRQIWLFNLGKIHNKIGYICWIVILSLLTLTLIATLYKRWRDVSKEYDARLILTTLTSMSSNYINPEYFSKNLPDAVSKSIEQLAPDDNAYAVFDLDNTILIDDIGDAVFAALVKKKLIKGFNWDDYQDLIKKDRETAYKKVVQIMHGLELEMLKETTYEILNSDASDLEIGQIKIPIPKPNFTMQSLISFLMTKGIEVYIVTASNKISAELICWRHFGIPSSHVFGAEVSIKKGKIISDSLLEIPYGAGKVNTLKNKFQHKPVITGGDGEWDKYLLDYTAHDGVRLWLGQNEKEFNDIKKENYQTLNFFHMPRK